jgi:hypothetical protein
MLRFRSVGSLLLASALAAFAAEKPEIPINYDEAKVPAYTLPDPLVAKDGTRITDAAAWRAKRRPEVLELFSREVYGRTPAGRPAGLHWAVTSVDRAALGGRAVRKEVTVWFTARKEGPKMQVLIYQPAGAPGAHAPWPAFLGYNFYGNQCVHADPGIALATTWMRDNKQHKIVNNRATEGTRGSDAPSWEIERVVARGYATVTIYYGDVGEERPDGITQSVGALFGTRPVEERRPDEWGALGINAWGLSRALDFLESDPEIDVRRVVLHGHSRLGKTALWAGAQDERFAMVISNNSGCGGAALSMRVFGENVERINTSFPYWFARNFRAYNRRESTLPVDQHELIALMAPRPVHVASAEDDQWADPRGEFLAAKHAEPVYALFGKKGLGTADMPAVNQPRIGDGLAYHIRSGKHDVMPFDWTQFLDHADKVFRQSKERR